MSLPSHHRQVMTCSAPRPRRTSSPAITSRAVGVDGCRGGWFAVSADVQGNLHAHRYDTINELWQACRSARLILVDIPIGLIDGDAARRACDEQARALLGPARNRVFWPPCRAAFTAASHAEASRINRQHTGRGLSIQSWSIMPRIREVDVFLQSQPRARGVLRECHPEVCFAALAGRPLTHTKKRTAGIKERLEILARHLPGATAFYERARTAYPPGRTGVGRDDIVDAMAACATAMQPAEQLSTLPDDPQCDAHGLPMEMVMCRQGEVTVG